MAVINLTTSCTLWCPHCGKVTSITCYRPMSVTTGIHTLCDLMRQWGEDIPKLEEYYDVRAIIDA